MTEPTRPPREPLPTESAEGRQGAVQRLVESAVLSAAPCWTRHSRSSASASFHSSAFLSTRMPDVSPTVLSLPPSGWPRRGRSRATDHRSNRDRAERLAESRCVAIGVVVWPLEHSRDVHRRDGSLPRAQQVFERLAGAGSSDGVSPEVERRFHRQGSSLRYVAELRSIGDGVACAAGLGYRQGVPRGAGVADVASLGGETMQYQVLVDPNKLAGAGLFDQRSCRRRSRQQQQWAVASSPRAGSSSTCADRACRHARGHRQHRPR